MTALGRIVASAGNLAWRVRLIQAGPSLNHRTYTIEALQKAVATGLFEGKPCKALGRVTAEGVEIDHQASLAVNGREVNNVVGVYRNARYDDATQSVLADLHLIPGNAVAEAVQRQLEGLERIGALGTFGLSIDGASPDEGPTINHISEIYSVDMVTHPAAGGRIEHRIAASRSSPVNKRLKRFREACKLRFPELARLWPEAAATLEEAQSQMATALHRQLHEQDGAKAPAAGDVTDAAKKTIEELKAMSVADLAAVCKACMEILKPAVDAFEGLETGPNGGGTTMNAGSETSSVDPLLASVGAAKSIEDAKKATKDLEAATHAMNVALTESRLRVACVSQKLGDESTKRVMESAKDRVLNEAECAGLATAERQYVDALLIKARVREGAISIGAEKPDRLNAVLAYLLSKGKIALPKECDITEREVRESWHGSWNRFLLDGYGIDVRDWMRGDAGRKRIKEAIDATNFSNVFADNANRALIANYQQSPHLLAWRKLVNIVSEQNFRTQHAIQVKWYGFLPSVSEGAPYQVLTSPSDREETYQLKKVGGIETVTLEAQLNDDIGAWQRAIARLGLAAVESICDDVFKVLRSATMPTMSDTYKLWSASRTPANGVTTSLTGDATGWAALMAGVQAMMKGTGGSGQRKGILPRYLVLPIEKAQVGEELLSDWHTEHVDIATRRGIESLGAPVPEIVYDILATDADDWMLLADPAVAEVIRVAFLGGREEPEMFFSDNNNFGSMFSNDRVDLKIRFIYAPAAVDWVGVYGSHASS